MRSCHTASTTRLRPPSESQSHLKRSKRSPDSPWPSKPKTDIDDLPDFVLVEILCRLPHDKFIFQCKSVCKRWSTLISDEKFQCRFLWLQSHNRKQAPVESTLIFKDGYDKWAFFILPELEPPMFKTPNFSLPLLGATDYIATSDDGPIVLGTCHDLVLCCQEIHYQRDYYICNPYTKQSVRLPPTPGCYWEVRVGFICYPYYKIYKEDVDDQKEESITSSGMVQVDADYRYAIVRICPNELPHYSSNFKVEIFSSETRKWTESFIRSPRNFCLDKMSRSGGIAYNGMLYWLSSGDGFIVGLDPFYYSNNINKAECPYFRLIDAPYGDWELYNYDSILSVCQGRRLRICLFSYAMDDGNYAMDDAIPSMSVFELKDDDDQQGGKWCNLTGDLDLNTMVFENPVIDGWRFSPTEPTALAFDPNNENILYLELFDRIVACNIRERKLKETTLTTMCRSGTRVFPFVLPRWPTPFPRLELDKTKRICMQIT